MGMPGEADVVGQLRWHAQQVADGTLSRPYRAVLIEFDEAGNPSMTSFGPPYTSQREVVAELLAAAQTLNAEAST